jgi:elongation factor Ts
LQGDRLGRQEGRRGREVPSAHIHAAPLGVLVESTARATSSRAPKRSELVKDIAQVAAANPSYVAREDIPGEVLRRARDLRADGRSKKPAQVIDGSSREAREVAESSAEQPFIKTRRARRR